MPPSLSEDIRIWLSASGRPGPPVCQRSSPSPFVSQLCSNQWVIMRFSRGVQLAEKWQKLRDGGAFSERHKQVAVESCVDSLDRRLSRGFQSESESAKHQSQ